MAKVRMSKAPGWNIQGYGEHLEFLAVQEGRVVRVSTSDSRCYFDLRWAKSETELLKTRIDVSQRAMTVLRRVMGGQQGEGIMLRVHFSPEGLVLSAEGDAADPLPIYITTVTWEVRSKQHLDAYGLEMHEHERLIITGFCTRGGGGSARHLPLFAFHQALGAHSDLKGGLEIVLGRKGGGEAYSWN